MRNFKTDKGYKVVLDYIDWYYSRKEVRDNYALDEEGVYICYPGDRELKEIMDLDIPKEGVHWLLRRHSGVDDSKENLPWRDGTCDEEEYKENEEYYLKEYGDYEKEYEIRPFYISYYGGGNYRVQFCTTDEAVGIMFIKRRKIGMKAAEEIGKKVFETYIEGNFMYFQIYSPHNAQFEEGALREKYNIIYYDYEFGEIFCLDEQAALDGIPKEFGQILPDTEKDHFESFELISKADNQKLSENH